VPDGGQRGTYAKNEIETSGGLGRCGIWELLLSDWRIGDSRDARAGPRTLCVGQKTGCQELDAELPPGFRMEKQSGLIDNEGSIRKNEHLPCAKHNEFGTGWRRGLPWKNEALLVAANRIRGEAVHACPVRASQIRFDYLGGRISGGAWFAEKIITRGTLKR